MHVILSVNNLYMFTLGYNTYVSWNGKELGLAVVSSDSSAAARGA